MELSALQQQLLEHYGMRVQPQMEAYVLRKLNEAAMALSTAPIRVIGGDARTGVPIVRSIDPQKFSVTQ